MENYRRFEVSDPFRRTWQVEFRWQQNGITIRHADTVDVKFQLICGEDVQEKVIALQHPDLLKLSAEAGRPLSDPWVMKLAALHLRHMIETDMDMDKTLVTASYEDLRRWSERLQEPAANHR